MRNVYTGFDTEYQNRNSRYNDLLSVQLAVCGELVVRVPVYTGYKIQTLNTLNDEVYEKEIHNQYIKQDVINKLLDERIRSIRRTNLGNNDLFMRYITCVLDTLSLHRVVSKVSRVDKGYNYYIFDKSNITKWFKVTEEYKLSDLVKQSTNMARKDLDRMEEKFNNLLQSSVENINKSEINMNDCVYDLDLDYDGFEMPVNLSEDLYDFYKSVDLDNFKRGFSNRVSAIENSEEEGKFFTPSISKTFSKTISKTISKTLPKKSEGSPEGGSESETTTSSVNTPKGEDFVEDLDGVLNTKRVYDAESNLFRESS